MNDLIVALRYSFQYTNEIENTYREYWSKTYGLFYDLYHYDSIDWVYYKTTKEKALNGLKSEVTKLVEEMVFERLFSEGVHSNIKLMLARYDYAASGGNKMISDFWFGDRVNELAIKLDANRKIDVANDKVAQRFLSIVHSPYFENSLLHKEFLWIQELEKLYIDGFVRYLLILSYSEEKRGYGSLNDVYYKYPINQVIQQLDIELQNMQELMIENISDNSSEYGQRKLINRMDDNKKAGLH
jgi:hypothetical protein